MAGYAWTELDNGRSVYRKVETETRKRSHLPSPMISTDTMAAVQHPCTGEMIDSKARFRNITKAHGCVEVGNDPARLKPREKPKVDRKEVRAAIRKAKAEYSLGRRPQT